MWTCSWTLLPQAAVVRIMQLLDPATLARALCCCTEWRKCVSPLHCTGG